MEDAEENECFWVQRGKAGEAFKSKFVNDRQWSNQSLDPSPEDRLWRDLPVCADTLHQAFSYKLEKTNVFIKIKSMKSFNPFKHIRLLLPPVGLWPNTKRVLLLIIMRYFANRETLKFNGDVLNKNLFDWMPFSINVCRQYLNCTQPTVWTHIVKICYCTDQNL